MFVAWVQARSCQFKKCEIKMNSLDDENKPNEFDAMELRFAKAALLQEIDDAWALLNAYLDTLTVAQMAQIRDPAGWAVKDHVAHLAAWERSVAVYLLGQPRYEGLGVAREIYLSEDLELINHTIQQIWKDISSEAARNLLRDVHSEMLRLLEPLGDDDLVKPNSEYAPSASGEWDGRPISGVIFCNTADHYRQHLGWIENLVSNGA